MYQPPHFVEDRLDVLHTMIRAHPLGLLVSHGAGGLQANPIPFLIDETEGAFGRLRAHVARANPQWRDLVDGAEVLVAFQGSDAYVTPSWYATKAENGKVVPTWNYIMVQARGVARAIQDPDWLRGMVSELTDSHEAALVEPWAVTDAPESYVTSQLRGIVGVEIELTELSGKWKVSQNRSDADRDGVAEGLGAHPMASIVRRAES